MSHHRVLSTRRHLCSFSRFPWVKDYSSATVLWFNYQSVVHPHQPNYVLSTGQNYIEFQSTFDLRLMRKEGSAALQPIHKMGFYPLVTITVQLNCLIRHDLFLCCCVNVIWTCLYIFRLAAINWCWTWQWAQWVWWRCGRSIFLLFRMDL